MAGPSPLRESLADRLRATWRGPTSFTAVVPMGTADAGPIGNRLARLDPDFQRVLPEVKDLHSFRLCAVPPGAGAGVGREARVLVNFIHDAPLAEHVSALITAAGPLLSQALAADGHSRPPDKLPALLARYRVREQTLLLGAIGQTVGDILGNHQLREQAGAFADDQVRRGAWNTETPAETIRHQTREHVLAAPGDVPRGAAAKLPPRARLLRFLDLLGTFAFPAMGLLHREIVPAIRRVPAARSRAAYAAGYQAWWLYGAIPSALSILGVRFLEKTEPDVAAPAPDEDVLGRLEDSEDHTPKNQVTLWFPVRPTWVRRTLLRTILWASERGCRHLWTDGRLSGIDTIHYARLMQVDGGRSMIFMSDYDGGLNRYLGDFLGEGSNAVIPISSNFHGCPKTRWLYRQQDPDTFGARWRALIRRHQLETTVWYSAYPLLTVTEILANARFREILFASRLTEAEARRWTRRL